MSKIRNGCLGCIPPKRHIGCHATCETYKLFKEYRDKKESKEDKDYKWYKHDIIQKGMRK